MALRNSTLDDISAVVGFTTTLRLAAWFGDDGNNLYIPDRAEEGQQLVKLIGLSAAQRLSDEWGSQHLSVPRLAAYEDDSRRRLICRLVGKGCSTREVSHLVRMSERRVQQICRELEVAGLMPVVVPAKTDGANRARSPRRTKEAVRQGQQAPVRPRTRR